MSASLTFQEPNRYFAGALALVVHLVFFALLYFGVRWQSQPQENLMVEMWDSLPNVEVEPEPKPLPPPPPVKMEPAPLPPVVAPALPPVKADIEVRDKKVKKVEVKPKPSKKDEAKEKAAAKAKREAEDRELEAYDKNKMAEQSKRLQAERARIQAENREQESAAAKAQVERYKDLIGNKIRRRMVAVADVPENVEVVFKVTLLPDGTLLEDPALVKSSGFPAFDNAVERAILSAQPLPVPTDPTLQKMFRELRLPYRAKGSE